MSAHGIAGPRTGSWPSGHDGPADPEAGEADKAAAEPRHLRVVDPRERGAEQRRQRVRLAGVVGAAFVVVLVFAMVGMHVLLAQNQFRLDRLNARAAAEQVRYDHLRLQVDQLASPERIVAMAESQLGMVQPGSVHYLTPADPGPGPRNLVSSAATGPGRTVGSRSPGPQPAAPQQSGQLSPTPARGIGPASANPAWSSVKPQLAASE